MPYEVELVDQYMNDVSELERENFMLRARIERLEDEVRTTNELLIKLNIDLLNETNRNASRKP